MEHRGSIRALLIALTLSMLVSGQSLAEQIAATDSKLGGKTVNCDYSTDPPKFVFKKKQKYISAKKFIKTKVRRSKSRNSDWRKVRKKLRKKLRKLDPVSLCSYNPPGGDDDDDDSNNCELTISSQSVQLSKSGSAQGSFQYVSSCVGPVTFELLDDSDIFDVALDGADFSITAPNFHAESAVLVRGTQASGASAKATLTLQTIPVVHNVSVVDHSFVPQNVTVIEDEVVRWTWAADFHDVTAGDGTNTPTGAFSSGILNTGAIFELTFGRNLLSAYPETNDLYNYFCTPHYAMAMVGTVKVTRRTHRFKALANQWEASGDSNKDTQANCSMTFYNSLLSGNCEFTSDFDTISIVEGSLGNTGSQVCTYNSISSGTNFNCALNASREDKLFSGQLHLKISGSAPLSRGQILPKSGVSSISGKVKDSEGTPIENALVTDGAREALTDRFGNYTLEAVPNGVYELSASKTGFSLTPDLGVSPIATIGGEYPLRSFTAE